MNLQDTLKATNFHFKKKYGQNFISEPKLLRRIAAVPKAQDAVLEIGAGAGGLTLALAERFKQVIALEIDRDLAPVLASTLAGVKNIELYWGDALKMDVDALMAEAGFDGPYAVVANLPYYITTPLVMNLLEKAPNATELVLMVQAEVAERFIAEPGSKAYGAVSVAVQYRTRAEIAFPVRRTAFTPRPAVDSAVLHLKRYDAMPLVAKDENMLRRTVKAAFGQRRKTLRNALRATGFKDDAILIAAEKAGIDLTRRGETLSLKEFVALSDAFSDAPMEV